MQDKKNTVIIFAASGGIGSALAGRLARQNDSRLILAGRSTDKLEQLAEQTGGTAVTVDATDGRQVIGVNGGLATLKSKR